MTKLEKIEDIRIVDLVSNLIKEKITKFWLKDILLGKRFHSSHFFGDCNEAEFFDLLIWDNLSKEQQKRVIESINLLIEEDVLIDKQPSGNYCFYLLDLATVLEKKIPACINSKPFLIWKEKNFFNLPAPEKVDSPLRKELTQKIEYAFGKN